VSDSLLERLADCATEISRAIVGHEGRGYSGERDTQYFLELVADRVALDMLIGRGNLVVSEDSGVSGSGDLTVVVDPIDGSTNCDHGVPFFATSFGVLRDSELIAGLVVNHATGDVYAAERGAGAYRGESRITPSSTTRYDSAIVAFSGLPSRHAGWAQYRALGAASLEICLVADGSLDAYSVARYSTLHPWDYLGGLLIAREAGAHFGEFRGEELVIEERVGRRPYFSATPELLRHVAEIGIL
jgi:myo-inositol-1(or 4)-monophosphatase